MQYNRFTIVALAITGACSSLALAEPSPAFSQCMALMQQNKLAEAEPFCAKAAEEPEKIGKRLYGDFLSMKGDDFGAIHIYSRFLEGADLENPTKAEIEVLHERALVKFRAGVASADDDAGLYLKHMPGEVELLRAGALSSESIPKRIEYADRLVALDPKSVAHHVVRSFAFSSAKQSKEALAAAETALKLDPNSALALTARAFAHSAAGNHAKAERDHAAAARNAPNEPDIRMNRADVLVVLKRYDEAIAAATEALTIRPDYHRALVTRADVFLAMGNGAAALLDLQKANAIAPDDRAWELQQTAEMVIEVQNAMTPESIAVMEQDRSIVIGGIQDHLRNACGYYSVASNPDNAALDTYRDCLTEWYKYERDDELRTSVGSNVIEAAQRFEATALRVDTAQQLLCSKMPKKSRCIADSIHARAQALRAGFEDPKAIVGEAEYARLNREIDVWNAKVARTNALMKTANFLNAVAGALSSQ